MNDEAGHESQRGKDSNGLHPSDGREPQSTARRSLLMAVTTGALAAAANAAAAPTHKASSGPGTIGVRSCAGSPLVVSFAAGRSGRWTIDRVSPVIGESLASAPHLEVIEGRDTLSDPVDVWTLRGTTSNSRYTTLSEKQAMAARQEGLGRTTATRAALIPIRKTDAWWSLSQDERRAIFEEQSHHIAIAIEYMPAIARRLHHSREIGEPFDFLTWFEYAPEHSADFEDLVERLRASPEWRYVGREVDIRLSRA